MPVRIVLMLLAAGVVAAIVGCPRAEEEEEPPVQTGPERPRAQAPESEPEPVKAAAPPARELPEPAESWTGTVVGITDADRLEVRRGDEVVKLRLYGVDAPERRQPFGPLARLVAVRMMMGREVTVHVFELEDYDHQGRTVAEVVTPEGDSLAEALVREGLAWWHERHVPEDELLAALQKEARGDNRGLWADAQPVAPWDFRDGKPGAPLGDEGEEGDEKAGREGPPAA